MSWIAGVVWYSVFLLLILRINVFGMRLSGREVTDKVCTPVMAELAVDGPCTRENQCSDINPCKRGRICCMNKIQKCRRCVKPDVQSMASREWGFKFKITD